MAQTVKLKRSAVSGNTPTTSDLALGEIAINTYDGNIFIKKNDGTESIVTFSPGSNAGTIEEDSFSGNGSTTAFTLSTAPSSEEHLLVFIDATFQNRDSFTISGTTITFDTAPDNGSSVRVYHVIPGSVDDGVLTVAKFAADTLVLESEGISSNDNDTTIPTSAAVKDYVDTQVATVDTLPEVLANGNTTGGTDISVSSGDDITFADSSKAIFGAGSDLQIYHDPNHGVINESGTGHLKIQGNEVRLQNVSGTENMLTAVNDGAVNLFYDNSLKLATTADGISVTSEVEADEFIGDLRGAVLFKAQAGENVTKGDVVYISGISGNTTVVSKADADDASKMPAFGIVAATTTSGQPVDIYTQGILGDLDTSAYSEGDELFVSTTAGALTDTPPTGESSAIQKIAKVTRSNNLSGSIFITGAGRTNAVPNLDQDQFFLGNVSNQAVATDFSDAVEALSINNVVEDTTPQLGGDLASNGNDILFADNDKAIFGAGSDLQIYHDGGNSYVRDAGDGELRLNSDNGVRIRKHDNETLALFSVDGSASLYYDNSAKIATTSTGIDVTGTVTADGLTVNSASENLVATFQSTDTEAQIALVDTTGTSTIRARNDFRFHVNGAATPALKISSNNDIAFYDDTGTSQNLKWDASADSLNFVDNAKANFGTGSDLSIYHSGTNSHIADTGEGNLYLDATNLIVRNGTGTETYMTAANNGGVVLYHDNTSRFSTTSSGIDVTGTVTADGLTVDGAVTVNSNTTTAITATQNANTDINGLMGIRINNSTGTTYAAFGNSGADSVVITAGDAGGTGNTSLTLKTAASGSEKSRLNIGSGGDISFYDDTGTSQALFWDASAESLGIGTTSPTNLLDIRGNVTQIDGSPEYHFATSSASHYNWRVAAQEAVDGGFEIASGTQIAGTSANSDTYTTRFTIKADTGNVGIGLTNPSEKLHVYGTGATISGKVEAGDGNQASLDLKNSEGEFRLISDGGELYVYDQTDAAERFRIDTSGNLLVAQSSTTVPGSGNTTTGISLRDVGAIHASRDGNRSLYVNRNTSDGQIISVQKEGTEIGNIGVDNSDNLVIEGNSTHSGLQFATNVILPHKNGALVDATVGFGNPTYRFSELYLSGAISSGAITSTGEIEATALDINGNGDISGNLTLGGYLAGPATFTIDPAAVGDNTGTVVIAGNLQVDGTTTTINSTTLTVDDKLITLASGAANAAAADGAGIEVEISGATNPSILYDGTNDEWDFNKDINVAGSIRTTGEVRTDMIVGIQQTGSFISFDDDTTEGANGLTVSSLASLNLKFDTNNNDTYGFNIYGNGQSTPYLRIDNSGNVGIGTTSPQTTLHLSNTTTAPILRLGNEDNSIAAGADLGVIQFYSGDDSGGGNAVKASISGEQNDTSPVSADLTFKTAHSSGSLTEHLRITSLGNVGIGTDSPASALHIRDASNAEITIQDAISSATARIGVYGAGGNLTYDTNASGQHIFTTNNRATEFMRIDASGNVGIGDTNPSFKLEVNNTSSRVRFKATTGHSNLELSAIAGRDYLIQSLSNGNFNIHDEDASSDRLTIDSSGRLLAGTTSVGARSAHTLARTGAFAAEILQQQTSAGASVLGLTYDGAAPNNTTDYFIYAIDTAGIKHLVRANGDGYFAGNVGIGNTSPNAKLQVEEYGIDTTETSTTATTQVAIHTMSATTFRSARFTVQVTNSTDSTYHLTEILMIHDGTTPSITEYGTIFTGSAEATFDADISSGNVRLLATPASTDTMEFKVVAHSITT